MTASTRIAAIIAALLFLLASPGEAAFLYGYDAHPNLGTLAEVQAGTAFRLRVDLVTNDKKNNAEQQSRLAFNGPVVELLNDPAKLKSHDLVSAPFAKLSSGGKKFKVLENAFFVGMSGMEKIVFEEDYWEMIWREDVRAGKLVCVFNLPFPVSTDTMNVGVLPHSSGSSVITCSFLTLTRVFHHRCVGMVPSLMLANSTLTFPCIVQSHSPKDSSSSIQ
jgi:hypothetical protein